jgi:hypothetical protein
VPTSERSDRHAVGALPGAIMLLDARRPPLLAIDLHQKISEMIRKP